MVQMSSACVSLLVGVVLLLAVSTLGQALPWSARFTRNAEWNHISKQTEPLDQQDSVGTVYPDSVQTSVKDMSLEDIVKAMMFYISSLERGNRRLQLTGVPSRPGVDKRDPGKRGPRFSVSGDLQATSDFMRALNARRRHLISASSVYNDLKSVGRK